MLTQKQCRWIEIAFILIALAINLLAIVGA